jgi:MFS family permease
MDEIAPTVKILAAIVLMPLTWGFVSGLLTYYWGWRAGVVCFPVVILCGYVAMRSLEEFFDMRGWYKAVLLLFRRRRLFLRLLIERRALQDELGRVEGRADG